MQGLNGLLVMDKPAGMTSHDVVSLVRRFTGEKSIAHLGTLDPLVTGVLPLLLGRFTRLAQFFGQAAKTYTGSIRFGFATDTYDADGEQVGDTHPFSYSLEELRVLSKHFSGAMSQVPPIFSAKKIHGVPAYKLARAGKDVPVKPAQIMIYDFDLQTLTGETATFSMTVSAGGYVRSVAHDLGLLAGCGAHLATLRRVRAGAFSLQQAVSVDQLKAASCEGEEALFALLPHPRTLLPEMPAVTVDEQTAGRLRNGMAVNLPEYTEAPLVKVFASPTDLIAIAKRVAGTLMQPFVVIG